MKIGVLALQGDFAEHVAMLKRLNVEASEVRLPNHLNGLDGLIIPGGESTTIGKLAVAYDLMQPLKQFGQRHAIWGTCAGAIFISKDIGRDQPFGRQIDSFETDLDISELKQATGTTEDYHAVFIRAPIIESVSSDAKILASVSDGRIVAAQQGHLLATSFHPELTSDTRFHEYFLTLVD
jgi:5'-phosphate synthase pdxT subunit